MAAGEAITEIHNQALDALETLVGQWRIEISNAQFLDEDARLTGRMSATWLDGRAFLVLRSVADDGPPASVQVIGRNEDRDDFNVLYADERGVSRVYTMTLADGEWTQSRADPGFHQRFRGQLSDDSSRIAADWSMSRDGGKTWQHDFDVTYTRT
jgi:hypothetical protein